jgi:para-nitrobenzyl esterase
MVRSAGPSARFAAAVAGELGVAPDAEAVRGLGFDRTLAAQETLSDPVRRGDLREPDGVDPGFGLGGFLPVIGDDVLPEHPLAAVAAGSAADVDLIVGSNSDGDEPLLRADGGGRRRERRPGAGDDRRGPPAAGRAAGRGDATPGQALIRVMNELVFHGPTRRLAQAHAAAAGRGRTYAYDFAWRSPACGGRLGACHGLELPFVFDTLATATGPDGLLGPARTDDPPQALADRMRDAWVAFARRRQPRWPEGSEPYRITH